LDISNIIPTALTADSPFNAIQVQQINWSANEIVACGNELQEQGESSRDIQLPISYLLARVVDWCDTHPAPPTEEGPTIRY
jgi:hypothetical protein